MDRPLIRDGAILFQGGTILDVGDATLLWRHHPDAEIIDCPGEIILPGLINAHTHLELSEFACCSPPASFVDWITQLVPRGQVNLQSIHESVARSIPIGVAQCMRFGVTAVGDISRHCTVSRPLLQNGPLRVISYGEVQAMAQRRMFLEGRMQAATDPIFESEFVRIAISPHAPYSVELNGYRRCIELATSRGLPLATHLAETPDEALFLANHSGRFRELWNALGAWDDDVARFAGGPIRFAAHVGLLDYERTLLAHVNYCDDDEMDLLARGKASVVYCPRTHAYFGHPPHRWRDMLARGINLAIGTDSCASSPDLNLIEELRLVRRVTPEFPAIELWKMATIHAARAIDMQNRIGAIRAGLAADFVAFRAIGDDPLESILRESVLPTKVWIGGTSVG